MTGSNRLVLAGCLDLARRHGTPIASDPTGAPRHANDRPIQREVSGFHARVVQHEVDHLDGILYPMRMRDLRLFGFTDVLFPDADVVEE